MAAPYNPPNKNEDFITYISLDDYNIQGRSKASATIASGDFKVSKDGGALANLATLPSVEPAGSKLIKITLSSTEMNADNVAIICSDQTDPPEWCDRIITLVTTTP